MPGMKIGKPRKRYLLYRKFRSLPGIGHKKTVCATYRGWVVPILTDMSIFRGSAALMLLLIWVPIFARGQEVCKTVCPEQRRIMRLPDVCRGVRPRNGIPAVPLTVADPDRLPTGARMSLNQAICIALENTDVIRVLGGSSGRTIYDPAVTNTQIDEARGRFDPTVELENGFKETETPGTEWNAASPGGVRIDSDGVSDYSMRAGVQQVNPLGGTSAFNVRTNPLYSTADELLLNPRIPSVAEFSYTQPLLRRGGLATNLAPIEIARIDTERSFFQMKDAVQENVRGRRRGVLVARFRPNRPLVATTAGPTGPGVAQPGKGETPIRIGGCGRRRASTIGVDELPGRVDYLPCQRLGPRGDAPQHPGSYSPPCRGISSPRRRRPSSGPRMTGRAIMETALARRP